MDIWPVLLVPSYPLKEYELWRTLTMESESGIEERATKWAYPRREWDLTWRLASRAESDAIRNFVNKQRGGAASFFWKEPFPTTRERVHIGWGTGSRGAWLLPVWDATSLTIRAGSTVMAVGSHIAISSYTGQNSMHVLTVSAYTPGSETYIPSGFPLEMDYVDGFFIPIVRVKELFQYNLQVAFDYGEVSVSFTQTKEQYPEA